MAARTVVVAVDASEHSRHAFEWFMQNVFRSQDTIVISHIPEEPYLPMFSLKDGLQLPVEEWQKAIKDHIETVRKLECDFETDLIARKVQYKLKGEQNKNPGEGIIRVVESENADLIVLGTRGLDVVRRTLLGSVSDYVVRHSNVPVIVCPKGKSTPTK